MYRFSIALLSLTIVTYAPQGAAAQPNVLFIAVDDLRPELGCYGVKHAKTPSIDRLAARGIVFDKAYCQQAVCSPSRASLLTGLRPDTTKVWDLETHFRAALPNCVTLPQHFKQNGYHTVAIGKLEHHGFEDGPSWSEPRWYAKGRTVSVDPHDWQKQTITSFKGLVGSEYAHPLSANEAKKLSPKAKNGPAYEVSPKSDDELHDGATAAEGIKRLAALKVKGEPFFLAVGFLKPHLPFVAPKKYWDMHDPESIPLPPTDKLPAGTAEFVGHQSSELHGYPQVPKGNPLPADFAKRLRHGYNACVSYVDAQVGRLLDALEQEGLAENTIIVLWGDHGWHLGEHGMWNKHTNFEVATRSPLLISVPKSMTAGRHCTAPVEFVDIYPTLAELCGLNIPTDLAGSSLKTYLDNPAAPMAKPATSQYPRLSKEHGGALMGYSIRNERWRCTFWRKSNSAEIAYTELYDEDNDPAETVNLAEKPEHAELISSMKKHLPATGSYAPGAKQARRPVKAPAAAKTKAPANETRTQRFERLYPNKIQLTLAEYTAGQGGDQAKIQVRFTALDANKDGVVTKEEFISSGQAKQ